MTKRIANFALVASAAMMMMMMAINDGCIVVDAFVNPRSGGSCSGSIRTTISSCSHIISTKTTTTTTTPSSSSWKSDNRQRRQARKLQTVPQRVMVQLFAEDGESAFVPMEPSDADAGAGAKTESSSSSSEAEEISLEDVEMLGRGAAKKKRGKRKGGPVASKVAVSDAKAAATLAPEETFYEGPPAITETIAPTVSILTVVGIIPAAAAWARQAWVRYKITSRRIRVTSGIGGNEMAEIVYPDVVEIRTAKRLLGDGDMVLFLRDGAKFEMRNIPNFDDAVEFVLSKCDSKVVEQYRSKGDVTKQ